VPIRRQVAWVWNVHESFAQVVVTIDGKILPDWAVFHL